MTDRTICFGTTRIDPVSRELRHDGEVVAVEPKVFDLLLFLAQNSDRVVGKEELTAEIWPGMVISETVLSRAIMKARKAVGDDSDSQSVLKTVHGHGYRFVAATQDQDSQSGPAPQDGRRTTRVAAGVVAVLVLLAALYATFRAPQDSPLSPDILLVAMLPVDDRTGDPELAWTPLGLMSYANRMLSEVSDAETVSPRRMMTVQEEISDGGQLEALQAIRKSLGASHLVHAQLRSDAGQLALDFRIFDASGAGPVRTIGGADPTRLVRDMTKALLQVLPGGGGATREFRSVSDDPFVNEAYARGLSLQLNGDVAGAREFFQAAVTQAPELFWPRYELALTMRDSGDLAQAQRELEALTSHADSGSDPEALAAVYNALGQVHWRRNNHQQAMEIYLAGLDAARQTGEARFPIAVLTNLGILARITGDLDGARGYLGEAMDLARQQEKPDLGYLFHSMGQVEMVDDNLALAIDFYRRAYQAFDESGNQRGAMASRNALARAEHQVGHFRSAEEDMLAVLEIRQRLGDYFGLLNSHGTLARLYIDLERFDEARHHAGLSLQMAEEKELADDIAYALQIRIEVALASGVAEAARADLERMEEGFPERLEGVAYRFSVARLALLEDRNSEGTELLRALAGSDRHTTRMAAWFYLGKADPDFESAMGLWDQAIRLAQENHESGQAALIRLQMARRALDENRPDIAAPILDELARSHPDWDAVSALAQTASRD